MTVMHASDRAAADVTTVLTTLLHVMLRPCARWDAGTWHEHCVLTVAVLVSLLMVQSASSVYTKSEHASSSQ